MNDIASETVISLDEAAGLFPGRRPGKRLNFSTVFRWVTRGIESKNPKIGTVGDDGKRRVKLEARRLGGRWITSREAVHRFMDALTPEEHKAPTPVRSPAARERAAKTAQGKLAAMGIT